MRKIVKVAGRKAAGSYHGPSGKKAKRRAAKAARKVRDDS